jgi:hypothetical protein
MGRKKVNYFWELVRRYREFPDDEEIREETLGLYCSKETAMNEREIYRETEVHEVKDEETVSLIIRKKKETIEEVELISLDELESLGRMFENENYYS